MASIMLLNPQVCFVPLTLSSLSRISVQGQLHNNSQEPGAGSGEVSVGTAIDPAAPLPCLRLGWLNPQQLLFGNYFSRSLPEDTASCPENVLGLQSGLELEVTAGRGRELSQSWGRPWGGFLYPVLSAPGSRAEGVPQGCSPFLWASVKVLEKLKGASPTRGW